MNKITVSLPLNVSDSSLPLFKPFLQYNLGAQKIKRLKNVFVTFSGFCINNKGLIKESHHDHPHQYADYQNQAAFYYYDVVDNPNHLIELNDNNTYLVIHHPWFNYYHWICECIFRAWMIKDIKDEMILVLPDYYEKTDFITGSLEPFGFKNIFYIPYSKSLFVRNLCLPQIKSKVDSYDYVMVRQIKNFYLDYVTRIKKMAINLGEKIYISRKAARRKRVHNEDEIIPVLLKYDFTILNNEDYNFSEQVAIYSNAKYLVSIHGSGLTNMLFMKEDSKILEFHKKQTNDKDWHSKAFWYMAEALGYQYYEQLCDPTDVNDDYFNANFLVDAKLLEKNLALMFN
jgi:capsular polysaccharide biosynthesis protein